MCSIRRLARLLVSLDMTSREPPPSGGEPPIDDRDAFAPAGRLVVQKGGVDRGRLTRLDSLGLVVRVKSHADEACSGWRNAIKPLPLGGGA
jgi:hypothetical protein